MNWFAMQSIAQGSVERVLNSLPEGILVALFASLLLRLIGRQNSGTRFAVWFLALLAVVSLSFFGGWKVDEGWILPAVSHLHSQIVVPAFWAVIMVSSWAIVSTLAVARLLAGLWLVWVIRRDSRQIDLTQLDPSVGEVFRQYSTGRKVRLATSERVKVPAAIGFWKPVIVLPLWTLRELSANELKPILIHELTHLNRRDDWTNLLQKFVRAIFFFHPAVWWIDARLSIEREMACDDAVLATTGNPRAYASCLIELLEKSCARRGWTMAQAAVHRAHELSQRITRIMDAKRPASTRIWKPALVLTSAFSVACFGISYSAPQLVAFGPDASESAAHMARVQAGLHAGERDTSLMQGTVVPASYHLPTPVPLARHQGTNPKMVKRHTPAKSAASSKLLAEYEQYLAMPHVVMTNAEAQTQTVKKQDVPVVQMVMFIESTSTNGPGNGGETQIWQIVLFTQAQRAAQAGVLPSKI